jgi:hypothetical protein
MSGVVYWLYWERSELALDMTPRGRGNCKGATIGISISAWGRTRIDFALSVFV